MSSPLPHERLIVYGKALSFARSFLPCVEAWPSVYAVRDQMDRACESLVTNLANAGWHQKSERGVYYLECSFGSALECAACLDIAFVKRIAERTTCDCAKQALLEIVRMEMGLRKSWNRAVSEPPESYGDVTGRFPHEALQVYQQSLCLCEVLSANFLTLENLRRRHFRRIDETSTSLLLNIAEGNGRFSQIDHGRFVAAAEEAGVKLAAYLDLLPESCVPSVSAKELLRRVMVMLAGLRGYLQE